ncbi:MAG: magnesium-translocating P-type ATPase [Rhodospirillaceae bacterium]|nr:magnesium-translocating P-type ATPase [Rhodospirillaceae bacterium]
MAHGGATAGSTMDYWSRDAAAAMAELGARPEGLTSAEAAGRRDRAGATAVTEENGNGAFRLALRQFESPLVLILVFAAIVSFALREWVDATIILVIVIGSTALGFAQEYRASRAVAELHRRLALTARVRRDGKIETVPAREIVPGDIVVLAAGNLIPADGRVLAAQDFLVSEGALTGESFPVEKRPGIVPAEANLAARTNCVFLGTSVRSGTADMLAVATGRDTAYGAVAARLKAHAPETEFARGVRAFGYLLLQVMVAVVLLVLTANLLLQRPMVDSLLFAVALAVGLSPELLPAIISVTLSSGARAMSRRGVIVRRLEAIENLGSIDVLCTDKTGTLTEGTVTLAAALDCAGAPSPAVTRLAFLNAWFETGIENPLDAALIEAGTRAGLSAGGCRKIDEIPYDFLRKRLTIVFAGDGEDGHTIATKGAFANVLEACTRIATPAGTGPLDDDARARLDALFRKHGAEGYRVLAVAEKRVAARERYARGDEADMTFAGLLLFADPPKPEAETAIRDLAALGIAIKIVSGDNRHVTAHLAKQVGLDPARMLTGSELDDMRDDALAYEAARTDLFVEVDPQQKERIVRALQRAGHAVGYMGDGINDAPALHAADIGISVHDAVDVARESADVILLERDLDVLRQGVIDGRRTFANTLKYIAITTSANFGNMISMAIGTLFLPFLPLVAKQILLNNFLSDLPSIAISTDNVDRRQTETAQRWSIRDVRRFMLVFGLISSAFDLIAFGVLLLAFRADEPTFQTAWFLLSLLTELGVLLVLRTRGPALAGRPSQLLLWSTVAVAAAAFAFPYIGPAAGVFGFVPLAPALVAGMVVVLAAYVAATEIAKRRFYAAAPPARR